MPQYLTLKRHRDLVGRDRRPRLRQVVICLLVAFPAVGLANVFGQQPVTSVAASPEARLQVVAADSLRGGLLGQQLFKVTAYSELKHATLVLDRGWMDGLQMNTIVPYPLSQTYRSGDRLAMDFGHLPAGGSLVVRIQFQVDPTTVGSRPQGVELEDGKRPIVGVHRTLFVFP
ncbi:MAG TPA: hypothetical protein VLJ76_05010 [Gaiellaceae bacterium]|nr:hypothetical protein [Gaiellaceae bacterium]